MPDEGAAEAVISGRALGWQEMVAYCRGAYCALSFEAVARLREKGLAARRLEGGMPEWIAAGLPIET